MADTNNSEKPLLRLLADVRAGRITGKALSVADRRAMVEHVWAEGFSAAETALLLNLSDRTIKRDRAAIRQANEIRPGEDLAREVVSEMRRQADIAVMRIRRAVRESSERNITPHMRIRAEQACFNVHRDLVRTLGMIRFIPVTESRFMTAALLDENEAPVAEEEEPLTETQEILERAYPWLRRFKRKPQSREEHNEEAPRGSGGGKVLPLVWLAMLAVMWCAPRATASRVVLDPGVCARAEAGLSVGYDKARVAEHERRVSIAKGKGRVMMDAFWKQTFEALRDVPIDAQVECVKEPVPYEINRVTFAGLDSVRVCAYLSTPIRGEGGGAPLPAIVTAPGYSGREFGVELSECQRGYAILQVYPRGQGESAALWQVEPQAQRAWLEHGKHDAERFYYRGAYADVVRGIDYLVGRDDVDGTRIAAVGTSQGGALTLAAAALDARVKAVVAHVPYLCDMRNNAAFASRELGRDEAFLRTFDTFDPINLAPRITTPALLSAGGCDEVSPPDTIHAVYARLGGVRSISHYPDLTHTSCGDFYDQTWRWLMRWV